jgi:hypothetical protein
MKLLNKSIILSVLITIFGLARSTVAQIPNPGFEKWSYDAYHITYNPDGWNGHNSSMWTTVKPTTESHTGSYAVQGIVDYYETFIVPPNLSVGFSLDKRPITLTGYYQFLPVSGDTFYVSVTLYHTSTIIATALYSISQSVSSYSQFQLQIGYLTDDTPDSCYLSFSISNSAALFGNKAHLGSYFVLDDLDFQYVTAVPELNRIKPLSFTLQQNYPNPFNPRTTIRFYIMQSTFVTLKVFDLLGREMGSFVNGNLEPGSYEAIFDGINISSGIYFYQLRAADFIQTNKMILQK